MESYTIIEGTTTQCLSTLNQLKKNYFIIIHGTGWTPNGDFWLLIEQRPRMANTLGASS